MNRYLEIAPEVQAALAAGKPVVALESTIISHGMPYPQNVETALNVERIVREHGAVPATSGGYGLLQWTSHPDDRKPWVEFTPKRRPFALGRVVIDALDRSLGRFHIEVFADGAWKTVFTCADGTKDNHFECAFPPVPNAERFRIVVDEPVGKLGRMRNFPRLENIKVARIGEVEAYAK